MASAISWFRLSNASKQTSTSRRIDITQNEPAFPVSEEALMRNLQGMSLRDYFAAKAMQGMWAADTTQWHCSESDEALASRANSAYAMAGAMLKARQLTKD